MKNFFTKPCWDYCVLIITLETLSLLISISVQLIFIAFLILLLSASPNYICSSWRFCARLYPQCNQQFSSCSSNHFCVLKSFVSPIVILFFAIQWPWTYCSQRLLYTALVLSVSFSMLYWLPEYSSLFYSFSLPEINLSSTCLSPFSCRFLTLVSGSFSILLQLI